MRLHGDVRTYVYVFKFVFPTLQDVKHLFAVHYTSRIKKKKKKHLNNYTLSSARRINWISFYACIIRTQCRALRKSPTNRARKSACGRRAYCLVPIIVLRCTVL